MEPSQFEAAELLQKECKDFLGSELRREAHHIQSSNARCAEITQFNQLVQTITKLFEAHAQQIQTEKLKSIGLRNIIDMQKEHSRRQEKQLNADIDDTTAELERFANSLCAFLTYAASPCFAARLTRTYESLVKVESEQRLLMDKLSSSD